MPIQASAASGRPAQPASLDPAELARFEAIAADWWDEQGPMAPLHKLNPTRIAYLRDRLCAQHGRDPLAREPLAGLTVLDVGCGGGLLCEPLARLGASVTGIDPGSRNLAAARGHAVAAGLAIRYRESSVEQLAAAGESFDLVCVMEVVEHVADPAPFLAACAAVVGSNGALGLATLNRTAKAFLLGIVTAEYMLGWLPRGSHDWRRFLRPSEIARMLRPGGLEIADLTGVVYQPLRDRFVLSADVDVNYMLFAPRIARPAAPADTRRPRTRGRSAVLAG